jgi:hypothetical protein
MKKLQFLIEIIGRFMPKVNFLKVLRCYGAAVQLFFLSFAVSCVQLTIDNWRFAIFYSPFIVFKS